MSDPRTQRVDSPFRGEPTQTPRPTPTPRPARSLRPITGYEEDYVEQHLGDANTARVVNRVIAQCLVAPGADATATLEIVRKLPVVERDKLLVRLRVLSFGELVDSVVPCPRCSCDNEVSFPLTALDLDVSPGPAEHRVTLGEGRVATLRALTAGDQEALLETADTPARQRSALLARVLVELDDQTAFDTAAVHAMASSDRKQLAEAVEAQTPSLDLTMAITCARCEHALEAPFDIRSFFLPS